MIDAGAPVSGSYPLPVFGNAMTSRIESVPDSSAQMRSQPNAIPPCGGAPYFSPSSRKPNFSCACSRLRPITANTRSCTERSWIRIDPPPISLPLQTMS